MAELQRTSGDSSHMDGVQNSTIFSIFAAFNNHGKRAEKMPYLVHFEKKSTEYRNWIKNYSKPSKLKCLEKNSEEKIKSSLVLKCNHHDKLHPLSF